MVVSVMAGREWTEGVKTWDKHRKLLEKCYHRLHQHLERRDPQEMAERRRLRQRSRWEREGAKVTLERDSQNGHQKQSGQKHVNGDSKWLAGIWFWVRKRCHLMSRRSTVPGQTKCGQEGEKGNSLGFIKVDFQVPEDYTWWAVIQDSRQANLVLQWSFLVGDRKGDKGGERGWNINALEINTIPTHPEKRGIYEKKAGR